MKNKMTEEKLKENIQKSLSIAETLRNMNMSQTTGNYKTFHRYIKKYNLDISHFLGKAHTKNKKRITSKTRKLSEILVENSDYTTTSKLKIKLVENNLLEYKCYECGLKEWNNKNISLQLDHINGISNDHRIENLRLLCPNCHSQTETFAGRNQGKNTAAKQLELKKEKQEMEICECGEFKFYSAVKCAKCENKRKLELCIGSKIEWPSNEELVKMLKTSTFVDIGEKLGVSGNSVKKHMKKRNLI